MGAMIHFINKWYLHDICASTLYFPFPAELYMTTCLTTRTVTLVSVKCFCLSLAIIALAEDIPELTEGRGIWIVNLTHAP